MGLTLVGVSWTHRQKVIEVMQEWGYLVVGLQNPVNRRRDGVKQVGGGAQPKGEDQIDIKLVSLAHPEEKVVGRVDGDVAVSSLDVEFGHECSWAE